MMDLNIEMFTDAGFIVGDEIVIADDLRLGDYVYMRREAPRKLTVHRVPTQALGTIKGTVFQLQRDTEPYAARFVEVVL